MTLFFCSIILKSCLRSGDMALLRRDSGSPPSTRSRGKVSEPAAGLTSTMLMLSLHPTSAKGGEWEKNNLPHARAVKATGLLSRGRFASAVVTHIITVTETKKIKCGEHCHMTDAGVFRMQSRMSQTQLLWNILRRHTGLIFVCGRDLCAQTQQLFAFKSVYASSHRQRPARKVRARRCVTLRTAQAHRELGWGLQRVINMAQKIVGCSLASLDDIAGSRYQSRAYQHDDNDNDIIKDSSHPGNHLFEPSRRQYTSHQRPDKQAKRHLLPESKIHNEKNQHNLLPTL